MEARATGKRMRVQPRKARLVARELKGKHALLAMAELRYHPSKGARMLRKVIGSAVGNAVENEKLDPDALVIARIQVDEGLRFKRYKARAMGRGNRILKRTSHITVVLEEAGPFELPKSNRNPKPRPKFEAPKPKKGRKAEETPGAEEPAAAEQAEAVEPAAQADEPGPEAGGEPDEPSEEAPEAQPEAEKEEE